MNVYLKSILLTFSLVLIFASCDKEDDYGVAYAEGWDQERLTAAQQQCVADQRANQEECNCVFQRIAASVPYDDIQTDGANVPFATYANECIVYAEGWNQEDLALKKAQCVENGGSEQQCNCLYGRLSKDYGMEYVDSEDGQEVYNEYYNQCFGEE